MGIVFRGFDLAIGRSVAVKVILASEFATPDQRAEMHLRFSREAAAAGRLSHPNIVTVYHFGEEGAIQFLVLELVDGCSLEATISDGLPQDPRTTLDIVAQVAEAWTTRIAKV